MKKLKEINSLRKVKIVGIFLILVITTLVYSNHFENPFFFDDSHTIESNQGVSTNPHCNLVKSLPRVLQKVWS